MTDGASDEASGSTQQPADIVATPTDATMLGARRVTPIRTVGITQGAALLVVAAVFVSFVLRDAFVAAHRTVGWVVACAIVALLIGPIVGALRRWLPGWASVVIVVIGVVAAFGGIVVGLAREVLDSLDDLERAAPRAARALEERYDWAADVDVSARVDAFFERLDATVREATLDQALGTIPTYLVTGILMLFLLGYGRRYFLGMLGLFDDLDRRHTVREITTRAARRGRTFMLMTLAYALLNAVVFGVICWLLDLPAPLSLAALVAIMALVPVIGIFVGGIPALLFAFASQRWYVGVIALAVLVVLQAVEAVVARPFIDRRSVAIGPAIPVVVGLVAFELYGIGGAVYGVALAVLLLAMLDEIAGARVDESDADDFVPAATAAP